MSSAADTPLAVDLDGTLVSSNLLIEGASAFAAQNPLRVLQLLGWMAGGRDKLKVEVAERVVLDPALLPYNQPVLAWLREQHASGRALFLTSAADQRLVDAVAQHLQIFDGANGTSLGTNLKAEAKRDLLVSRFGTGGFDYLGDHTADLAVWSAARTAHVVGGPGLVDKARGVADVGQTFARGGGSVKAFVKALRPHQWAKNALVAVPLLAAQMTGQVDAVLQTVLAIVLFCMSASGIYLINDVVDVAHDRQHPVKRRRPFAAGSLSLLVGWVAAPVMTMMALVTALLLLPVQFAIVLVSYLVASLGYAFWAKGKVVLDVITLGGLYTIRIVAGAAAIQAPLTLWLITFSMLFFLSLALIKRVSELTRVRMRDEAGAKGRGYYGTDLELLSSYGVSTSVGAVVIFSIYLNDPRTETLYLTPSLLGLAIPILLAWLMRCWLWAHRGDMNEDPIVFAVKDRKSQLAGVLFIAVFLAANVIRL